MQRNNFLNNKLNQINTIFMVIFLVTSAIFVILGMDIMYNYKLESAKIFEVDFYNFIIMSIRGVGFICTGIMCSITSAIFALFIHKHK